MSERNDSTVGRREFLRLGAAGALGTALGATPRRDAACILIWQDGGCSHLDTFDMKPEAPREIRGEFREIPTNVPGIRICEHLPLTARHADKYTIVRSLTSDETNHERASAYMQTGARFSLAAGGRRRMRPVPALLPAAAPMPAITCCAGLPCGPNAPKVWMPGPGAIGRERVRQPVMERAWRLAVAGEELRAHGWDEPHPATETSYLRVFHTANEPAAEDALNLRNEPRRVRERYGYTGLGQGCLAARRMVQAGARLALVGTGMPGYDTHTNNFARLKDELLPEFDRAFSGLLQDLAELRLLETTLVIVAGEFGRTPRINPQGGRDHHARAWSAVLAGAGVPGGHVLGATDKIGAEVVDLPVRPADLAMA